MRVYRCVAHVHQELEIVARFAIRRHGYEPFSVWCVHTFYNWLIMLVGSFDQYRVKMC
jgi:hypothetical protein